MRRRSSIWIRRSILTILLSSPLLLLASPLKYSAGSADFEGQFFSSNRKQAKRFQKLGYNVFVADIYGAGVRPKSPNEAGALAGKYGAAYNALADERSFQRAKEFLTESFK